MVVRAMERHGAASGAWIARLRGGECEGGEGLVYLGFVKQGPAAAR